MAVKPHPTGRLKIRRGDMVQVTTGKDVGRTGKVLEVNPTEGRLIVEKLNIVHKHTRPRPVKGTRGAQMTPGGVLQTEALASDRQRRPHLHVVRQADARRLPRAGRRQQGAQVPSPRLRQGHRLMASPDTTYHPRLQERYRAEIVPALNERFGYSSIMQVPRLLKITLNMGVGEAKQNSKVLDEAVEHLTLIAGQKPVITKAKRSIAGFKLREGMPIGCKVTLRDARMWEFLDRLTSIALPRVRDFRGVSPDSFDGRGNYSLGIREQTIFPEIDYDRIDVARGLDVTITTTAPTDDEARELLRALGMPFRES